MPAPVYQSSTSVAGANGTSCVYTLPSSIAANDIVVLQLYKENTNAVTPPAGFAELTSVATGAGVHQQVILWKRMAGGESGTVTASWTGNVFRGGHAHRISGCATSGDPWGTNFNTNFNDTPSTNTPAVSLATSPTNSLLFWGASDFAGSTTNWTPPSGFTDAAENTILGSAWKDNTAGGATGSLVGSVDIGSDTMTAFVGALSSPSGDSVQPQVFPPVSPWITRSPLLPLPLQAWPNPEVPAIPSDDLDTPLLSGDSGVLWQIYNSFSNSRSRISYEADRQRRRDSSPDQLGQPLLENELLGGATTVLRANTPATHADRREVPQQRQLESVPGLLDTALLEVPPMPLSYLEAATHKDRRFVPQYTLRESPVGLLDEALLEVPPMPLSYLEAATHKDRRFVPQYTLRESPVGLLDEAQLEVPPPLAGPFAVTHRRIDWLRLRPSLADQSSAATVEFDPTLAGCSDAATLLPVTHKRPDWFRQKPIFFDQSVAAIPNLALWFRAADLAGLADGTAVSTWASAVGSCNAAQGTGANQPTKQTIFGQHAVRFDGIDDLLMLDGDGLTATQNTGGVTFFVRAKLNNPGSGTANRGFLSFSNGLSAGSNRLFVRATATLNFGGRRLDVDSFASVGTATANIARVTVLSGVADYSNSDAFFFVDGVAAGSTTTFQTDGLTENTPSVAAAIGASADVSTFGALDVYEILVYKRALTTVERQQVETYLQALSDNPFEPTYSGLTPELAAATHQRLPWLRIREAKQDQSDTPVAFDPVLAGYGWIAELMPSTHKDRRLYPMQRPGIQNPDDLQIVGTGATMAWWGLDDSAHHFAQWLPTVSDPSFYTPPVAADPTQSGYGPRWMWYRAPVLPVQRDREAPYGLLDQALLEVVPPLGASPTVTHQRLPWLRIKQVQYDQSVSSIITDFDPTQAGYGPRWMWYRSPVAPVQLDRESDPQLLSTAQFEDPFSGAWEDLLRHRTWYVSRRLYPQQRDYKQEPPAAANPLLVAGAEWRYKLIPVTHKARWVLRQWWQQQTFQGSPVILFEGTVTGGVRGGPGIVGGVVGGAGTVGGTRGGYITGGLV